jgi:anti-sigma factor RsiW
MEGSSEFGQGSTSRLRRTKGYAAFAIWLILGAMAASYFADWAVHGDPSAAAHRFLARARVVIHVLEALGDD